MADEERRLARRARTGIDRREDEAGRVFTDSTAEVRVADDTGHFQLGQAVGRPGKQDSSNRRFTRPKRRRELLGDDGVPSVRPGLAPEVAAGNERHTERPEEVW